MDYRPKPEYFSAGPNNFMGVMVELATKQPKIIRNTVTIEIERDKLLCMTSYVRTAQKHSKLMRLDMLKS